MGNIDRILWPVIWMIVTPVIIAVLWTVVVQVLPVPDLLWGSFATLVILAVVCSVPIWVLRSARKANHTAGAVLSAIALVIGILSTLAVMSLKPYLPPVPSNQSMPTVEQTQAVK